MKIAITSDWHFRAKDLCETTAQLTALVDVCIERGVDCLCHSGDVFDSTFVADTFWLGREIEIFVIKQMERLIDARIRIVILRGNHDYSGPKAKDTLRIFDDELGNDVIREPKSIILEPTSNNETWIHCIPWMYDRTFEDCANSLSINGGILLAHVQPIGAKMNSKGMTCEQKDKSFQCSRSFLESLDVDHIALGDYHTRQELVEGKGGVVGALRQCNFGEEGNPQGFEIYDTNTKLTEWIELHAYRPHLTIVVTDPLKDIAAEAKDLRMHNRIRVRYEGCKPTAEQQFSLHFAGASIEQTIEAQERTQRAEVPEGITDNPNALIDLWSGAQNPPVDSDRISAMKMQFERTGAIV